MGDLVDRDTLEAFARSVIREHGRVDVLVNNAAGATSRKKMNRPEFSGRCFLLSDGLVAGLRDAVAVAVLGLPLVSVLVFFGEKARHDGGDDTAVGDEAGILRQPAVGGQDPRGHLCAAFTAGGHIALVIPGEPGLVVGAVFQVFVAVHFKSSEVHLPESGGSIFKF